MKNTAQAYQRMLCTDLDGTFIGDDASMYELLRLLKGKDIALVFSTGRHLPSICTFISQNAIRPPEAAILMVGTEIYFYEQGDFIRDTNWTEIISRDWDRQKIRELLADIEELVLQDEEWQTPFKLSYYLGVEQLGVLAEIKRRIHQEKIKVRMVYSAGRFLDFLPHSSGKAKAVEYLARQFSLNREQVVVCGDSGNDLDVFEAGFKGIIVGNAHPELKSFTGNNAYHATASYAAGIIEGLRYFNFI